MGALINLSIDIDKLPREKFIKGKKGTYYNFTLSINDDTRFGNNVSAFDSQTKEEREAKKTKSYLGNGKVVWTDGKIVLAEKEEEAKTVTPVEEDDLPF